MRKKIQEIIRGKVETPTPAIILPEKDLQISVIEHDVCQGSFSLYSGSSNPVRGLVTSPDPNLICMTPKFDGKRVQILFEYHGKNMEEGDEKDGYFVITSNAGEYIYPYHVHTTRNYAHTSIGWIKSLDDFTNLAKLNWQEALNLFRSVKFTQIFRKDQQKEKALYLALSARGINSARMEEFLVGAGCKERGSFHVNEEKQTFVIGRDPIRESIRVEKSQWGYLPLHIACDAPFVRISEPDQDDFASYGKFMEAGYSILPNLMHGGRNFARITISDIRQTREMEVVVVSEGFRPGQNPQRLMRIHAGLMREYLEYRMGRRSLMEWKDSALDQISSAIYRFPEDPWLPLYEAWIYLTTGDSARGGRILDQFAENTALKRTPEEGFYQYLTSLRNPDPAYHKEVVYYERELFKRYRHHPVLAWVLLQLDEALLRNEDRRYTFLRQYLTEFSAHPVLYYECARLVWEHPDLLALGGTFERRLVRWMQKNKEPLANVPAKFWAQLSAGSDFRPYVLRMMTDYYADHAGEEMLKFICSYLIKTGSYSPAHSVWYRQGIDQNIKVAGLYEAFLRTWERGEEMPAKVRKYFMLQRDLPWKWKAKLYAYVLDEQPGQAGDREAYEELIRAFAKDSLKKRYMNRDMIRIYRYLKEVLPEEEWNRISEASERTICVTAQNPAIRQVCLAEPGQRDLLNIALHDGMAFLRAADPDPVLLMMDHLGNLYVPDDLALIAPLFEGEEKVDRPAGAGERRDGVPPSAPAEEEIAARLDAFDDTIDKMDALIMQGRKKGLASISHEEQLLARMLFTGHFGPSHETFFEDVVKSHENPMLCDAYACSHARAYLTDQSRIPTAAVYYILYAMQNERVLNDECMAALLKYHYTTLDQKPLLPRTAERMLRNSILKGEYLGFYNQLPDHIKRSFLLTGILFIQYAGSRKEALTLETALSDPADPACCVENSLRMEERMPGIYCVGIPVIPGYRLHYRVLSAGGSLLEDRVLRIDSDLLAGNEASMYGQTVAAFSRREPDEDQLLRTAHLTDLTETLFGLWEE